MYDRSLSSAYAGYRLLRSLLQCGLQRNALPWSRLKHSVILSLHSVATTQVVTGITICFFMLIAFTPLHVDGDNIVPSIMSLQKVTVYYWWQDRFGSLTPALTIWIRDPIYNLYAQISIQVLAGLVAPLFFCSLVFRRSIDSWRATLVSDCLVLIVGPGIIRDTFFAAGPYGVSLAVAGLATLVLRAPPDRLGRGLANFLGMGLLLAAYVVNFGLVTLALPVVFIFAALIPSVGTGRLAALHLLAAAVAFLAPAVFSCRTASEALPPVASMGSSTKTVRSSRRGGKFR